MLDDILKNFNVFVDGRGYAGNASEVSLPKLTMKTDETRNGGMDAPLEIPMGMEKLECSFSLTKFDKPVLKSFGLAQGEYIPVTFKGILESENGLKTPVSANIRGMVKEIDPGTWKPGDKATLKVVIAVNYYKLKHGGSTIHEIDVINMVRKINGVDQLLLDRLALGV